MTQNIGADPIKVFGLQKDVNERLEAAVRGKNLGFVQQLDCFLKLSNKQRNQMFGIKSVLGDTNHLKLVSENILVSKLEKEFDPRAHFNGGAGIKYWLVDDFKKYVLNPAKTFNSLPEVSFAKHSLKVDTYDSDIMSELDISPESGKLMTREEILWTIADLTSKQPKGQPGELLTNGYATIIGYMRCDDGVVRAVDVFWHGDEWHCDCRGLGRWRAGRVVLSRNAS